MPRFSGVPTFTTVVTCLLTWQQCAGFSAKSNNYRVRSSQCNASEGDDYSVMDRRELLDNMVRRFPIAISAAVSLTVATLPTPPPALALDFDAFESGIISKDSESFIPKLNDDEALCRYGAPGKAMGVACERAKMKPNLPSVVDASGKVDRGDYLKCKILYPVVDGEYVKTRVCKPSADWGGGRGEVKCVWMSKITELQSIRPIPQRKGIFQFAFCTQDPHS